MKKYSIFDAHCDTLSAITDSGGDIIRNGYNLDKSRMEKYKSYTQVFACFISPEHRAEAWKRFFELKSCFDSQCFKNITPIMSVESADMVKSVDDIKKLKEYGVKILSLTWNYSNHLAGGADEPESGLTPLGKEVVEAIYKNNILLDVSHLNDRSFYEVAEVYNGPLCATHSNSRYICNHRRNLTDEMFKMICKSGGCVGINLYPPFLSEKEKCTSEDVIKHIEHFMLLGGENHIGIGADFDGTENLLPEDIQGCEELYRIFDLLIQKGYSNEQVEKISHKNFERIFKKGNDYA